MPSLYMKDVVAVIQNVIDAGGNLPDKLEPVIDDILHRIGTDKALWPAMRRLAERVHAVLPQRMQEC